MAKQRGRPRLQFDSEAKRKAHHSQLNEAYRNRKRAQGYQRATLWLPGHILERLRTEAQQKDSSLEALISEKLEKGHKKKDAHPSI